MTDTQQIKDKIDIASFIGEYVQLKPSGINHKGLCPFHREKSPSFMVNRDRQSWHCFGCNKGGDIFSFLQEMEHMEFVEALRYLADRAGIVLTLSASTENKGERSRLKEISQEAARFFHRFLCDLPQAKEARDYVAGRGLLQETIDEWQIGFAPEQWDLLTQYLIKKGYGIDELVSAGLTIQKEGADKNNLRGFYDRFRGRVMFPIRDHHGSVVGFTGRVLKETENSGGKYVNTPQTLIFDKSRLVFGLDKAKQAIRETGLIVLVEGQMDVLSSHQAGLQNVVASSGTALTEEHAKLLARYAQTVAMAFDQDSAGIAAAKRGIEIALTQGLQVKVISIPDGMGKDPDECVKKNKEAWFSAVAQATDVLQWYFDRTFLGKDIAQPRVKQGIADELVALVMRIPHAIERDYWMRELATKLHVDIEILREQAKSIKTAAIRKHPQTEEKEEDARSEKNQTEHAVYATDRLTLLTERLCTLLLLHPPFFALFGPRLPEVGPWLSTAPLKKLYETIKMRYTDADIEILRTAMEESDAQNIVDLLRMKGDLDFSALQKPEIEREANLVLKELQAEGKRIHRQELLSQIEVAEKAGEKERVNELLLLLQGV